MAVKRDTAAKKQASKPTGKKIAVTYISDDESAARAREAAIKSSPAYQKAVQERQSNTLLSQELLDRAARRSKRKLSVKEVKLIQGIVSGKKRRQAARDAGITGSDNVVSATTSRMLSNVNVKLALQEALAQAGVGVSDVAQVIADGLKAEQMIALGNGEDKIVDFRPDHSTRLRAGAMAAKYLGAEDTEEKDKGGNTFNFNFHKTETFDSKKYVTPSEPAAATRADNAQEGEVS